MNRVISFPAAALVAGLGAACAGHRPPYNPFLVPQSHFTGATRTIAVVPLTLPSDLPSAEPVRAAFDSVVETVLRGAGFAVVPARATQPIWTRISDSLARANVANEMPDSIKFQCACVLVARELADRFKVDAVLFTRIVVVAADFRDGTAKWDGTEQSYMSTGKKFLSLFSGETTYGTSPALSLEILIADTHGTPEYRNRGGIQLRAKPAGDQFVDVPMDQLLANRARNAAAAHIALEPLVTSSTPPQGN